MTTGGELVKEFLQRHRGEFTPDKTPVVLIDTLWELADMLDRTLAARDADHARELRAVNDRHAAAMLRLRESRRGRARVAPPRAKGEGRVKSLRASKSPDPALAPRSRSRNSGGGL